MRLVQMEGDAAPTVYFRPARIEDLNIVAALEASLIFV